MMLVKLDNLKNKRIGLVLSGGGAKGAYQVGMFRVLEELGLAEQIIAMSGCSIGAFAEVIYSLKGVDEYRRFLMHFPDLIQNGSVLSAQEIAASKDSVKNGEVSKESFCSDRQYWQYEAKDFQTYFETLLEGNPLKDCGVHLTACCYSIEDEEPHYFKLQEMNLEEQINAIIGSGSLPYVFAPRKIGKKHYLDGGAVPNICKHPAPHDKIPLRPMTKEDVDVIIVNYLMPTDQVDLSIVKGNIPVIEIRPSVPLEDRPGSGTSDFSEKSLIWREQLGYEDTKRIFTAP